MEEQKTGKGFIVFIVLLFLGFFIFLYVRNVFLTYIRSDSDYVGFDSNYIDADSDYFDADSDYFDADSDYFDVDSDYFDVDSDYFDVDSDYIDADSNYVDVDSNYVDVDGNEFKWEDIMICNSDNTSCITLMDRNLGATTNDISKTGSYGYYFQWGNNYGFIAHYLHGKVGQVDASGYGPDNPYNSDVFLYGYTNRNSVGNDNLWGGSGDSQNNHRGWDNRFATAEDRQGPCPQGYHVPSIGERNELLYYWYNSLGSKHGVLSKNYSLYGLTDKEGIIGRLITEYFNIPTAGNIITNRWQQNGAEDLVPYLVGLTSTGTIAEVRSSTPFGQYDKGGSYDFFRAFFVSLFENSNSVSAGISGIGGSEGLPVRCFKNPDSVN